MKQDKKKTAELVRIDIFDEKEKRIIISYPPTPAGKKAAQRFTAYANITIRKIYNN